MRGRMGRQALQTMLKELSGEGPAAPRAPVSALSAFQKLKNHRRVEAAQDEAERAIFQQLLGVVEVARGGTHDELLHTMRAPGVHAPSLSEAVPPIQNWLVGLTQWLSPYQCGRIIARRRAGAQQSRVLGVTVGSL